MWVVVLVCRRTLALYARHRQRKRELQAAWHLAMARVAQRGALRGWRERAVHRRAKRLLWAAAEDAHRLGMLHRALTGQPLRCPHTRARDASRQRAGQQRLLSLAARRGSLAAWSQRVAAWRAKAERWRRAGAHHRQRALRRAYQGWARYWR